MSKDNVNKKLSNSERWDIVIYDAKQRIEELQYSVEVFKKNKRDGKPFSQDWLKQKESPDAATQC